ncbi:hypothetical protein ACP4OV_025473 [Aristida adscensionis]
MTQLNQEKSGRTGTTWVPHAIPCGHTGSRPCGQIRGGHGATTRRHSQWRAHRRRCGAPRGVLRGAQRVPRRGTLAAPVAQVRRVAERPGDSKSAELGCHGGDDGVPGVLLLDALSTLDYMTSTLGYIDRAVVLPHRACHAGLRESDVFGLGAVVLEVVCGRRISCSNPSRCGQLLE